MAHLELRVHSGNLPVANASAEDIHLLVITATISQEKVMGIVMAVAVDTQRIDKQPCLTRENA